MKKALILIWDLHGKRHNISHRHIDARLYEKNHKKRIQRLEAFMHDNGIGA